MEKLKFVFIKYQKGIITIELNFWDIITSSFSYNNKFKNREQ